jgi:hypothetical protein
LAAVVAINLLIKLSSSMLPRLCNRVWLTVNSVKVETYVKCSKINGGFTNVAEHKRCILTYAGENNEGYKQRTRFCSHNSTIKGLVLCIPANIIVLSRTLFLLPCFLNEKFSIVESDIISAVRFI